MPGEALYAATKYGVRGLTFSLRAELRGSGIDVAVVCPASVRTPQLEHELRSGEAPMSFVGDALSTDVVARAIVRSLRGRRAEVLVPPVTGLLARALMALPDTALRLVSIAEWKGRRRIAALRGVPSIAHTTRRCRGRLGAGERVARPAPHRVARLLALVQLAFAAGIAAFWAAFAALGPATLAGGVDPLAFLAFETAFPVADACLAVALVISGWASLRGRPLGAHLSIGTGGALVFLGLVDTSFNALQGAYGGPAAQVILDALLNGACIVGGVLSVRLGVSLHQRDAFTAASQGAVHARIRGQRANRARVTASTTPSVGQNA
jgi:hypothetical protein